MRLQARSHLCWADVSRIEVLDWTFLRRKVQSSLLSSIGPFFRERSDLNVTIPMHLSTQSQPEDKYAQALAVLAKQVAWRTSAAMLIALIVLNVGMVIITVSRFGTWFAVSNGINLILALGLIQTRSWARIMTVIWEALGISLALALAVQSGATSDLLVTVLLQGGILLPLIGPPHKAKNVIGIVLFVFGLGITLVAFMAQRVVVR